MARRLVAGFAVAVLVGVGTAAALVHWGFAQIDRSLVAGLVGDGAAAAQRQDGPPRPRLLNVLLVGNDSREGLTRGQIRRFATGRADGNRTDTVMLLQLELDGPGRGAMLSLPRDLLVTRCDGSRGRLNAAYGVGIERDGDGPSCLVQTVSDLTGVSIHHYVEVSFAGFVGMVDALGGVGLYLDEPVHDEKTKLSLDAGCVRLKGPEALSFVRARHLDNDFGRMARQQRFIKETLREATDIGLLADPARAMRVVEAAASSVKTDDALDLATMREIVSGVRRLTASGLEVHTVPSDAQVSGGTWYVVERSDEAAELYAAFRDGSITRDGPPAAPADDEPALPPVTVLNGTDHLDGVAATAAQLLQARGFTVDEVADAEITGLETTRILHPPELAAGAQRLARLFPGADVVQGVAGLPLTVKLGADVDPDELAEQAAAAARTAPDAPGRDGDGTKKEPTPTPAPAYRGAEMTDVDC